MMGGPIGPLNRHEHLHFDSRQNIHMSSNIYEANGYMHNFGFVNYLALIVCFISASQILSLPHDGNTSNLQERQ